MASATDLHALVHQASVVIAHYWPMTTFVHHNPIRSLETYPFHEATAVARRFIGGRGYLPNEMYRKLVKNGRITSAQLDTAVQSVAQDATIDLGGQTVRHAEVLRAHLLEGITPPLDQAVPALVDRLPNSRAIRSLAKKLNIKAEPGDNTTVVAREMTPAAWCDQFLNTDLVWQIDREVIKWCEAFMDEGQASWPMPHREKGFYAAWRRLASKEWSPCGIQDSGNKINALPESPEKALLQHLDSLAIPEDLRQDYLSHHLTALYGWASFIHWRSENPEYPWQKAHSIDLIQYLAVRLFYEKELVQQTCRTRLGIDGTYTTIVSHIQHNQATYSGTSEHARLAAAWRLNTLANVLGVSQNKLEAATDDQLQQLLSWLDAFPESDHGPIWLNAYEAGYHQDLIGKIQTAASNQPDDSQKSRPLAQLMFCIDVRSEPFRRNLESVDNYETIGFAGFFGIPISCQALDHHHETDQCPAILKPAYTVHEVVRDGQDNGEAAHNAGVKFFHMLHDTLHDLKSHVLTPYIMVESIGWFFGWHLIERTFFPGIYRQWNERIGKMIAPPVITKMTADEDDAGRGLSEEKQIASIEGALRTMGLTENFGRLVIVGGHTSMSDNNPFDAALNCGACGGNSGEPNARLFAAIANKTNIRQALAKNGIVIPDDTHFIGGVHNTTTDAVDLYDLEDLPETHREDVKRLQADLQKAAVKNNLERCLRLPGVDKDVSPSGAVQEARRRSGDWSETRPEWGLSGNASFIIGRRTLTQDLNLEGRAFLNSHDYRLDPTGALLEGILMGPMVVGQWINAEHYFSATDPDIYGSGSKVYHNVVGRVGIMAGPQSDLRTGLPIQSMAQGELTYHEPLRLFVAIEAPRQRILDIVERQPVLKQLCDNEWIHLMAIDYESDKPLYRYRASQGWIAADEFAQHPELVGRI
ncbi:MAG: DUF2309 domain-containing protein [Vampirovibrio sp.]|nr:DUF2309 domain-containing protein [Vampirovibrio sp.]